MDRISKHIIGGLWGDDGQSAAGKEKGREELTNDRILGKDDVIYELTDVIEEGFEKEFRKDGEILVIDGRVYERVSRSGDRVFDLTDVVEEGSGVSLSVSEIQERIMRRVDDIVERVAREIVPEIAEKIIREEIEKLKRGEE